jgi:Uma2 family endonuclease
MARTSVPFETVGEMLEQLGDIDPRRVRSWPPPGQATEADVLRLLDHENRLFELVDGTLVEKCMGSKESSLMLWLGHIIQIYLDQNDRGLLTGSDGPFRLLKRLVRYPDIGFVEWSRFPNREYPMEAILRLHPDLAVEILSPGNTKGEMARKLKEYFLAGTRLVWYVDPDARSVTVYTSPDEFKTLTEGDTLNGGEVLPGFSVPLKQLFVRVPRVKNGKTASKKRKKNR